MPLYLCLAETGRVPEAVKEPIANAFTEIHCGLTFAPPSFVHVYFIESERGSGGVPPFTIVGNIRADRTEQTKDKIIDQMRRSMAGHLGVGIDQVTMTISETPANWTMEGGHLLPDPGEEDAWMERHNAMIKGEGY